MLGKKTVEFRVGGSTYRRVSDFTSDNFAESNPTVTVATAAQLTTRTDNDTGVVTLPGGHSIATGKVDVYWTGGSRVAMDGTVSVNALTVDGGSGDNLPSNLTSVRVKNPQLENLTVAGNDVVSITLASPVAGTIHLAASDGTTIHSSHRLTQDSGSGTGNFTYFWDSASGVTNPIAGDSIGKVLFSADDTTSSNAMYAGIQHN